MNLIILVTCFMVVVLAVPVPEVVQSNDLELIGVEAPQSSLENSELSTRKTRGIGFGLGGVGLNVGLVGAGVGYPGKFIN